ncbi:helix-turn-helix transcriptional regulator [Pararhodobacter oceanensis]|uniref:helix-turn-helix transcriptional regulator n=1 Tax=Pararhodobacter oceanensis TaxID=2172121 RepID=UPI003A947E4F
MFRKTPVSIGLLIVVAVQLLLAALFLGFVIVDVTTIRSRPVGYNTRELFEIFAILALVLSIAINVALIRNMLRRADAAEKGLMVARGAFQALVETEFDRWGLSRTEREVALFAIKGLSNAEIAEISQKSEGTVKSQSAAVFRKAGVQGRIGLVTHFMDEIIGDVLVSEGKPANER